MKPDSLELVERLQILYRRLIEANQEFLAVAEYSAERLQTLLDQRDLTGREIRDIEAEIRDHLAAVDVDAASLPTGPLLKRFIGDAVTPAGDSLFAALLATLRDLVSGDREVEQFLTGQQTHLQDEMRKLRKGASLLRGYHQADPTGSCFIDKIK